MGLWEEMGVVGLWPCRRLWRSSSSSSRALNNNSNNIVNNSKCNNLSNSSSNNSNYSNNCHNKRAKQMIHPYPLDSLVCRDGPALAVTTASTLGEERPFLSRPFRLWLSRRLCLITSIVTIMATTATTNDREQIHHRGECRLRLAVCHQKARLRGLIDYLP